MEGKKVSKLRLTTFLLIVAIIVIIIQGVFIYKLYNDKTNEASSSIKENSFKNIILDGNYTYAGFNGDIGWNFSKDGRAAVNGDMFVRQGTYKTIKENYIEIHYTKSRIYDDVTGKETTNKIDEYEYISIDNENNIYLTDSNGNKDRIERYGDVVEENFN